MATRNTLKQYARDQLIDRIECLEHNNAVLSEALDNQYHNATKLLDDMNIFNEQYKKAKCCKIEREVSE